MLPGNWRRRAPRGSGRDRLLARARRAGSVPPRASGQPRGERGARDSTQRDHPRGPRVRVSGRRVRRRRQAVRVRRLLRRRRILRRRRRTRPPASRRRLERRLRHRARRSARAQVRRRVRRVLPERRREGADAGSGQRRARGALGLARRDVPRSTLLRARRLRLSSIRVVRRTHRRRVRDGGGGAPQGVDRERQVRSARRVQVSRQVSQIGGCQQRRQQAPRVWVGRVRVQECGRRWSRVAHLGRRVRADGDGKDDREGRDRPNDAARVVAVARRGRRPRPGFGRG